MTRRAGIIAALLPMAWLKSAKDGLKPTDSNTVNRIQLDLGGGGMDELVVVWRSKENGVHVVKLTAAEIMAALEGK